MCCARSSATCARSTARTIASSEAILPKARSTLLKQLKLRNDSVALLLADQRMPHMDGVAFLQEGMRIFPDAKRALLTAYADTNAAISAINEANINYFFMKPWDPPTEHLYPQLDDLLDDWQASYPSGIRGNPRAGHALVAAVVRTAGFSGAQPRSLPVDRRGAFRQRSGNQAPAGCAGAGCRQPSRRAFPGRDEASGKRPGAKWRKKWDCGRARKPIFTIWRSSAEGRRAWPPPCMARRRACTR